MKRIDIKDAKTNLSSLLAKVESDGQQIVICCNGQPVADLIPHQPKNRIKKHPLLSKITINYNPVESLAADEWPG